MLLTECEREYVYMEYSVLEVNGMKLIMETKEMVMSENGVEAKIEIDEIRLDQRGVCMKDEDRKLK